MVSLVFKIPTTVYSGEDIIKSSPQLLALGTTALIVTGKSSAEKCGALDDVKNALDGLGIRHAHFNGITENPRIEDCYEGARKATALRADFIIAIGGGSPIDAAKAIAAYAANPQAKQNDLYDQKIMTASSLPLIAVPTTAGTGSEVNNYAVITQSGGLVKKTFKSRSSYPTLALLDPKYTYTLSNNYTMSTALDALCHSIESYMSPKSTPQSEALALHAAKLITSVIFKDAKLHDGEYSKAERAVLLNASCLAGMAIAHTGTGFPHPLGYSITLSEGVPHGKACAVFESAFLTYNELTAIGAEKASDIYKVTGIDGEVLKSLLTAAADVELKLTPDEIDEHVSRIENAGNFANSPYCLNRGEMIDIYTRSFGA